MTFPSPSCFVLQLDIIHISKQATVSFLGFVELDECTAKAICLAIKMFK